MDPRARWHVSPIVDLLAYHFSWVLCLVPLLLSGDRHPTDYMSLWVAGITLTFLHRMLTLPYVYLDRHVLAQHVTRFTLFSFLLVLGFIATAFLWTWKAPARFFRPVDIAVVLAGALLVAQAVALDRRVTRVSLRGSLAVALPFSAAVALGVMGVWPKHHVAVAGALLVAFAVGSVLLALDDARGQRRLPWSAAVLVVALLAAVAPNDPLWRPALRGRVLVGALGLVAIVWNVWHTYMQKFGILRLYAAKSGVPSERRTPAWVDRLFVLSPLPLLVVWLDPAERDTLARFSKQSTAHFSGLIDVIEVVQPLLLVPAFALVAFSFGTFVVFEHRAGSRLNSPRPLMCLSLLALASCFLWLPPLKVYVAFGFSHALEYMVFVWAFWRRRYAQPLAHRPLLQRVLRRPVLAGMLFFGVLGGAYCWIKFGKTLGWHVGVPALAGVSMTVWLAQLASWSSLGHFYFDGFLWKMRLPAVRDSI